MDTFETAIMLIGDDDKLDKLTMNLLDTRTPFIYVSFQMAHLWIGFFCWIH